MTIQLSTAFDPGDFDQNQSYAQVAIEILEYSKQSCRLVCYHGNTISGVWERGSEARRMEYVIPNEAPGYELDALVADASFRLGSDPIPTEFYQWLIDNGHFAGTVL